MGINSRLPGPKTSLKLVGARQKRLFVLFLILVLFLSFLQIREPYELEPLPEELLPEQVEEEPQEEVIVKTTKLLAESFGFEFSEAIGVLYEHNYLRKNVKRESISLAPLKKNKKYFVFQTSGGISNQRKILEWALQVCVILDRVCVLPPAAAHTTRYYKYNALKKDAIVSMDQLLDLEVLLRKQEVLVIQDQTFIEFVDKYYNEKDWHTVDRSSLKEKRADPYTEQRVLSLFGPVSEQVLYFSKGSMWQCFDFNNLEPIQEAVRFHLLLREFGKKFSLQLNKDYNALHIRFPDGETNKARDGWLKSSSNFLSRMRGFNSKDLYIATVPSKQQDVFFHKIKEKYNVTFFTDLKLDDDFHQYILKLPEKIQPTFIGIIEQLICARSLKFLGTGYSTFSEHIRTMRRLRKIPAVSSDSKEFLEMITPCRYETRVC